MTDPLIIRWLTRRSAAWSRSITLEGDRDRASGDRLVQVQVRFADKTRPRESIGGFQTMERIGEDRSKLSVRAGAGNYQYVPATKAGVDSLIRRARPQDLERLVEIDAERDRLNKRLGELRRERIDVLHEAWQKGHKVTLQEMVARATQ